MYTSLSTLPVRELNRDESNMFIHIASMAKKDVVTTSKSEIFKQFPPASIILSRLPKSVQVTEALLVFILYLSEGVPGRMVMWGQELKIIHCKNPERVIDAHVWAESFPLGVPTPESYGYAWDSQRKTGAGNWLDTEEAWSHSPNAEPKP